MNSFDSAFRELLCETLREVVPELIRKELAAYGLKPAERIRYVTMKRAAELTGYSVKTISRAIYSGALPAGDRGKGPGARKRIRTDALDAWMMAKSAAVTDGSNVIELARKLRARAEG